MDNIQSINPSISTSSDIRDSRAYTFMDSYIYMRNRSYNALYDVNKKILTIEREGIEKESVNILYYAAISQTQALATVIARVRDFSIVIREDVVSNIMQLIPSDSTIKEFDEAVRCVGWEKEKFLHYTVKPIDYPNVATFYNYFKDELESFTNINNKLNNTLYRGNRSNNCKYTYIPMDDNGINIKELNLYELRKNINGTWKTVYSFL